jgi:hypothetical protein
MINKILLIVALLVTNAVYSQFLYPIVTTYKGDSIVILTTKQARDINSLLDKQHKRIQVEYVTVVTKVEKIDSLTKIIYKHKTIVDSIKIYDSIKVVKTVQKAVDSLKVKLDTTINWINKVAVNNSFMYIDYCTNKLTVIDLNQNKYIGYFNPITGSLTFSRSKSKSKLDNYMYLNPNRIYNKSKRPKVYFYPYKPTIQK